ncbi:MAG: long-chain-fatty-acid--CoA ligase [Kineosporiaceae bacterium]
MAEGGTVAAQAPQDRPWLRAYAPGVPADVDVPEQSLVDLLAVAVSRFGDRPALDFFGVTTSYASLAAQVERAASLLASLGVAAGDRVALVLPNCPQHVVAFYAALRLGAVVVEHNPLSTVTELRRMVADHEATVAVVWDVAAPRVAEAAPGLRHLLAVDLSRELPAAKRLALRLPVPAARRRRTTITSDAWRGLPHARSWDAAVKAAPPLPSGIARPGPHDVALLQYTGGTTGTPKGAVLTHRNLLANVLQGRAWVPGMREGAENVYAVLPLFHAYGLTLCLTFAVSMGATLVLFPTFDVDAVLARVRCRPPTFFPGVPPIYERLALAARDRGVDLSSCKVAISGAMPLPERIVELWESVTGGLLVEGYGMTESSPVALGNPISPARRPGAVGLPFPSTDVRVVDPEEPTRDVAPGERGELLIRGPQVFSGYWRRHEETAAALLPGGWLRTGDVVVMDADGFVTVVDRIKELIITGGFNVYPSEVEDALRALPGVRDAAVIGLPSDSGGEEVVAAVVAEGSDAPEEAALRAALRTTLAAYKVPRRVVVVEELPRSQIGKVLRRQVREDLAAQR